MKRLLKILGIVLALLVLAFLVLRVPDTDPAEMRAKYGAGTSQFVELDDGQVVHLRDEGPESGVSDAPAIILLHGSNADLHTWDDWAKDLQNDYRVIRFDQIGHGLTGPSGRGNYELADFHETIDALTDRLDIDRFILVGNSMGGAIAMGYAIEHPQRLAGLVLVDAGGADIKREGGSNLAFSLARMPVIGTIMSQLLPRSVVKRSLSQSVANQDIVTDEAVDRYWEMARYPGNREATRKRFSAPRETFAASAIRKVEVPTLVMWGDEDSLIPVEAANWYHEQLPNSTVVIYDGIGHIPMEEAPQESVADLRAFVAGLPYR